MFTASLGKYADPLLDLLDKANVVRWRLFREACYPYEGSYVKVGTGAAGGAPAWHLDLPRTPGRPGQAGRNWPASTSSQAPPRVPPACQARVTPPLRLLSPVHVCLPSPGPSLPSAPQDLQCLGRDLGQTIIVDNSPHSYMFQPENALPIGTFIDDMQDQVGRG